MPFLPSHSPASLHIVAILQSVNGSHKSKLLLLSVSQHCQYSNGRKPSALLSSYNEQFRGKSPPFIQDWSCMLQCIFTCSYLSDIVHLRGYMYILVYLSIFCILHECCLISERHKIFVLCGRVHFTECNGLQLGIFGHPCWHFFVFNGCVLFHEVDVPQSFYQLLLRWASVSFQCFDYCGRCCCKYRVKDPFLIRRFHYFVDIFRS